MALRLMVVLLSLNLSFAAAAACEQSARSDDERLTALLALKHGYDFSDGDVEQFDEQYAESFRTLWCDREYGEELSEATDEVVSLRLRAVRDVAFYARPDWILERFQAVVAEALSRGLADSRELDELFTAFQVAGNFEAARRLRAEHSGFGLPEVPQLSPPPEEAPNGARKVWHVDAENNHLRGEWLSLKQPRLLVVTSPGCGFCRAAAKELLADEVLAPLMRTHAVWLAERSMNATFQSVAHWNEHYPEALTILVDDADDWPIADFDFTPHFHFVRDGKIIHSLAGWLGGPDALQAIAEGFDHLGLLDASQLADNVFAYAERPSYTRGCPEREEAWERIRELAPIATREALERHLAAIKGGADSPLKKFSSEGLKRFVSGMGFRDDGSLMGFGSSELRAELQASEIYEVTALFGQQYAFAGRLFEAGLLSEEERQLNDMLNCEV